MLVTSAHPEEAVSVVLVLCRSPAQHYVFMLIHFCLHLCTSTEHWVHVHAHSLLPTFAHLQNMCEVTHTAFACVCVCVCERETETERERECMCVCVRERKREIVYVCVCETETDRPHTVVQTFNTNLP